MQLKKLSSKLAAYSQKVCRLMSEGYFYLTYMDKVDLLFDHGDH